MSIADLWKSREPADLRRAMKEVDDELATAVQTNFAQRTVRPRDINVVADAIDQVDSKLASNVAEREELYRERDALHAELSALCIAITDQAQRVKERYLGRDKGPEPINTWETFRVTADSGEPHEGDQSKSPRPDPSSQQ
jgi:hypothetical protein